MVPSDPDQSSPTLHAAQANISIEQQQAFYLQKAFLDGTDGYVDAVADEAEPMAVTRGMGSVAMSTLM